MPRLSVQRSKIKLPEESVEVLAKNTKLSTAEVKMIAKEVAREMLKVEKEEEFNKDLEWQYSFYTDCVDEREVFKYHISRRITDGFEKLVPSEFTRELDSLANFINEFEDRVKTLNAKFFQSHKKLSFEEYKNLIRGT